MKIIKKSFKFSLIVMLVLVNLAASCKPGPYQEFGDGLFAEIVTEKDTIVVKLTPDKTPVTVANFVALAEGVHPMVKDEYKGKRYYDGLTFHRVLNDFMIQGGDPTATGSGDPGYKFETEADSTLKHNKAGILSMANSGGWGTNGSQFFITHKETPWLDTYDENGNLKRCSQPRVYCHTVFGEVVKGQEVVDAIVQGDTMLEVNIIRQGMSAKNFDAVSVWESELPQLEERIKNTEEEARRKAEEEKAQREAKIAAVAAEFKPVLDGYNQQANTLASGLKLHYIKKGTGTKPKTGQTVTINYQGYFTDGKLFDSNLRDVEEKYGMLNPTKVQRQMYQPMPMQISPDAQMIAGFKEAAKNMRVGDQVFVYIPSHLAYGEAGRGMIKPNTDLQFIMEMVGIQ
ncbi:MAG: peptidylprolyl isomerase [Flavobacteriaceae bacterium]|nr:MAG: peptidylprolyl isomerase [Flavobacteriaceae bacterium]